jgi:hypothetical protein
MDSLKIHLDVRLKLSPGRAVMAADELCLSRGRDKQQEGVYTR